MLVHRISLLIVIPARYLLLQTYTRSQCKLKLNNHTRNKALACQNGDNFFMKLQGNKLKEKKLALN